VDLVRQQFDDDDSHRYQHGVGVLIFSKTCGYRHDSIPAGIAAISRLVRARGLDVAATEDAREFCPEGLAGLQAVVWLSTMGTVLSLEQRCAFEVFVRAGGAYVGIHAASASETDWDWYGRLVGARFTQHPEFQAARVVVEDREHLATRHLSRHWLRSDEWYDFDRNPRPQVQVLLSVEEASYRGGGMGSDHPLAWCRELDGGRSFYTALGHAPVDYEEPDFLGHLDGGLGWALARRA
jgi:type 1 glutamine amidotransferase